MPVTKVAAFGWDNCARLHNDHAELLVTLDVGPRVLSYKLAGGENVLRTFPNQLGKSGEKDFQVRGGHRIWASPENDRTYAPDNGPATFEFKEPNAVRAITPADGTWKIRKEMTVSLAADGAAVMIQHQLTNEGTEPTAAASWGLTIMTPGGWEIIPQPPLGVHGRDFLPNRVIVPWTYTDLSDDRWKIGKRFWLLHPKAGRPSAKLGFAHRERWIAHVLPNALFLKTFDYEDGAAYPDLGCNYETFSKDDFVELETLSPMRTLGPGESVGHTETWHLFGGISQPDAIDEAAIEKWLQPFLSKIGIL